jgi:two-component system, chemotaxis family, protein-glutamate methylesterase/glutaminase
MKRTSQIRFDIVAIASSAGGVRALMELVAKLPRECPPVVVAQHLPLRVESNLVGVLRARTDLSVKWAGHGDRLMTGTIYVGPQNSQVTLSSSNRLSVFSCAPNRLGTPPADPLFASVAKQFMRRAIGVVLTGLLSDGAEGVQAMKRYGATVLIQKPDTALASEMPEAAIETKGLHFVLPLNRIAPALSALISVPAVAPLPTDHALH